MMGIVLSTVADQRCTKARVDEINIYVVELKNRFVDMEPTESFLLQILQRKFIEKYSTINESQRRHEVWIDKFNATDYLATGISFYDRTKPLARTVSKRYVISMQH